MVDADIVEMRKRRLASWFQGPLFVAVAYYVGAEAAFAIGTLSDRIFAPFWPPNAILFCALTLAPFAQWPLYIAAVVPAHVIAELGIGMGWTQLSVAFVTNCNVAALSALVLRLLLGPLPWLNSLRVTILYVVVTAIFSPALTAFGGAFVRITGGHGLENYWLYWSQWYVANALGSLTLGAVLLSFMLTKANPLRVGSRLRLAELLLLMLGLAVACSAAFSASSFAHPIFVPALLYLPLPLVIWAAVRFGTLGASASIFVVTVASISTALHGPTIFEDGNVEASVRALQLLLVPLSVSALLLGAAIDELQHGERIAARVVQSVIAAQDDERRTLAKHLIDDVCQRLAASTWETVQERKAVALEREVQRSIRDLRELSYVLHPPMLEDAGLELALRAHLHRHFEHTGVAVTLDISGFERLPAEVELTIFRVVEEALANIKQFDRATARISIQDTSTSSAPGPVIAAIEHVDRRSAWFPRLEALIHRLSANKSDAEIGQVRMRERLRRVGGSLETFRGARNTLIRATIPIISGALPVQGTPQKGLT